MIVPSTAIASPAKTRSVSPALTSSAGIIFSPFSVKTRAFCGVRRTSFSISERAFAAVSCSKSPLICIINATSPAAKYSPMHREAMSAIDTRTSALISKAVISPMIASKTIGAPHNTTETQAASKGRLGIVKLITSEIPLIIKSTTSFLFRQGQAAIAVCL